jgi:hypothetical protein
MVSGSVVFESSEDVSSVTNEMLVHPLRRSRHNPEIINDVDNGRESSHFLII